VSDQTQRLLILLIVAVAFVIGLYGIIAGEDDDRNDQW
jgi:hypothetical protein